MRRDRPALRALSPTCEVVVAGFAAAFIAAMIVATIGIGAWRQGPTSVGAYTTSYDHRVLDDPFELLIVQSDGQAFASLARDPSLARPEVFRTDAEAAYRAQRPLFGHLAWALSLGRPGWVPPAMALLSVAGAGLAAAGVAQLLRDRGAPAILSLITLLFPGTYMALSYLGPEPLGLGLVTWGLVAWSRRRIGTAVALFAVAGLCRETLLLVAVGVALGALRGGRVRDALRLAWAVVPYAVWVVIVHARIGAWPTDAGHGRLGLPFTGLVDGLAHSTPGSPLTACLIAGTSLFVLWRTRGEEVMPGLVVAHLGLAVVMGREVWISWEFFGRILLPLNACALVVIAGLVSSSRRATSGPTPPEIHRHVEPDALVPIR